jgi:hypothetical protein
VVLGRVSTLESVAVMKKGSSFMNFWVRSDILPMLGLLDYDS